MQMLQKLNLTMLETQICGCECVCSFT